jgi:hypothetical protein
MIFWVLTVYLGFGVLKMLRGSAASDHRQKCAEASAAGMHLHLWAGQHKATRLSAALQRSVIY